MRWLPWLRAEDSLFRVLPEVLRLVLLVPVRTVAVPEVVVRVRPVVVGVLSVAVVVRVLSVAVVVRVLSVGAVLLCVRTGTSLFFQLPSDLCCHVFPFCLYTLPWRSVYTLFFLSVILGLL